MAATLSSVNLHHNGMSHLTIKNTSINILLEYFIAQHVMYVISVMLWAKPKCVILLGSGKNLQRQLLKP